MRELDTWVPACGGAEEPTRTRQGRMVLYVWNAALRQHRYLDLGSDMILPADYNPMEG
jgi:hypothetical protein